MARFRKQISLCNRISQGTNWSDYSSIGLAIKIPIFMGGLQKLRFSRQKLIFRI
jgi:hypothetical protein